MFDFDADINKIITNLNEVLIEIYCYEKFKLYSLRNEYKL